MTLLDLLILLLVAGICGALGQAIAGYSRGGCLVSIALGFGRAARTVARTHDGTAGTFSCAHWRHKFSDRLVNYRLGVVCGRNHTYNAQPDVSHRSQSFCFYSVS